MKTRFSLDVPTGVLTRSAQGVVVPKLLAAQFTARDVLECEVLITAGATDITADLLPAGTRLTLGLRQVPGVGPLLAMSDPHTLVSGVAQCTFSLNTQEIADLVGSLSTTLNKPAKVWFEIEIAKPDASSRQTLYQAQVLLYREVNQEGDEPPATAAASAETATAARIAAEAARDLALAAKTAAEAARDLANTSASDSTAAAVVAQAARDAGLNAQVAAQAARDAAQAAQTAAAAAATAAASSETNAATSAAAAVAAAVAAQAAQTAAETAQAAAVTAKNAALASQTAAALSETNAATSAAAALASQTAAAASAALAALTVANQFLGGVAGNAVPATAAAAGNYYRITAAGTSQSKTWAGGDMAIYNGTSGSWTQLAGILPYATDTEARAGTDTAKALTPAAGEARALLGTFGRQQRDWLYCDGVTSNRRLEFSPGPAGAVAAMPLCIPFAFEVPTSNPSVYTDIVLIGQTVWRLSVGMGGNGRLSIVQYGTSDADYRQVEYAGFRAAYSGLLLRGMVVFSAGDTTLNPLIYLQGVDATASFTPATGGMVPNWLPPSLVTSTYWLYRLWPAGRYIPHAPIIGALTAAEVLAWTQTGRLPIWCEIGTGSMVPLISPTVANGGFETAGAGGADVFATWSETTGGGTSAITAEASIVHGGAVSAKFSIDAAGNYATVARSGLLTPGAKYRLEFWARDDGTGGKVTACANNALLPGGVFNIQVLTNVWTKYTVEFVAVDTGFQLGNNTGITQANKAIYLDDVTLTPLGPVIKPVIQPCNIVDDAGTNGICGVITPGVTPITDRRDWRLRASVDMTTTGNKQLFGAAVFDKATAHAIDTVETECAGAPTFSLGDGTTATKYTPSVAHSAGRLRETLSAAFPADSAKTGIYANVTALHASSAAEKVIIRGHRTD